jgi:pimeloyl-ACP methyl ester carboxylesterase
MQLVFIHGSGASACAWKYQTEHFAGAEAVTLPGREGIDHFGSIADAVAWLKARIDAAGWRDVVLVGHSLGGAIALQYALDHPADLRAIITVGSGARLRVHPDTLADLERMCAKPAVYAEGLKDRWEKVEAGFAEVLRADAAQIGPEPFLRDLQACDVFDVVDRLGEIDLPAHAIVGTEDVMTPPKYSTFLRDRMPNATMTVIEGGTHSAFAEYPDQVNAAIDSFLLTIDTRGSA